jgi:hypothetical protein
VAPHAWCRSPQHVCAASIYGQQVWPRGLCWHQTLANFAKCMEVRERYQMMLRCLCQSSCIAAKVTVHSSDWVSVWARYVGVSKILW